MNNSMSWLVFGAGAIGTYIGGNLLLHGHRVTFLEQPGSANQIRQGGLTLRFGEAPVHIADPNVVASLDKALQFTPFDAGIFALKSYDTQSMLEDMAPYRDKLPPLVCLQNGVENEYSLAAILGSEKVIAGTVTSAVSRYAVGDILLERRRGLGISSLHVLSEKLIRAFNSANLNARLYSHPLNMKWSKMLTNLVGNATSAILDLPPAEIFAHPLLYKLEINQLRETLTVMRTCGLKAINLPGVPVQLLALAVRYLPDAITRMFLQRAVGQGRGSKMPSFHIDLHSGRGQSEVDFLNGAVVRAGQRSGVPTPVNASLNRTLLDLTQGTLSREQFSRQPEALLEIVFG